MCETVQHAHLGIADSGTRITCLQHSVYLPIALDIIERIGLFCAGPETCGIHCLEFIQSFIEKRKCGESEIVAITAGEGNAVWDVMAKGAWSRELVEMTLETCPFNVSYNFHANCATSDNAHSASGQTG